MVLGKNPLNPKPNPNPNLIVTLYLTFRGGLLSRFFFLTQKKWFD